MVRILLVEDDQTLARLIKGTLRLEGHDVLIFDDAADAFDHLDGNKVDLVIVDYSIPFGDDTGQPGGKTLIAKAKSGVNENTPFLSISGSFTSDPKDGITRAMKEAGAAMTLGKPFHPDELIRLVATLLSNPDPVLS